MTGTAEIVVVGLSHHAAPLAVRERLAVPADARRALLHALRAEGVREAAVLSTCNRVEVYAAGEDAAEIATSVLCARGGSREAVLPFLTAHRGEDAVRHACRVASGLDSMVLGEPQILGQFGEAFQDAEEAGTLGPQLTALRTRAQVAAKRVRTETGIGRHAVSLSHVAVELARKVFGTLEGSRVLLVGAGKMCRLAAEKLVAGGAQATVLGGRTLVRAEELAQEVGAQALPLSALREALAAADIVICGTGAPGLVVSREDVAAARRTRPLLLVDLALPRDVDPEVRSLPATFLYDLDDLQEVAASNLRERAREKDAAEAVVSAEVAAWRDRERTKDALPLLVDLRRRGEDIRRAELAKVRGKLEGLTPEQEAAVEAVTTAILNKLLHAPTVSLKELAREGRSAEHFGMLKTVLGLS